MNFHILYKRFAIVTILVFLCTNLAFGAAFVRSDKHNLSHSGIIKSKEKNKQERIMSIEELRKDKLIDIFCTLAQIPSPSGQEQKVAKKIIELLSESGIEAYEDNFGNVRAKIPATDSTKQPLLLSAHMDVIGDNSPVNIKYDGKYIETDKKRTLGADDKAGVAAAINLAIEVKNNQNLKHGGLELVFTKDEEQGLSGINHVDFSDIESEYVLVLDADKLGQILVAGASYTNAILEVKAFKGGHSGIDIADTDRVNAVKLIGELINQIPQGVYKSNELGVVTSINIGSVIGGGVEPCIKQISDENIKSESFIDYVAEKSMTNLINTYAKAADIEISDDLSEIGNDIACVLVQTPDYFGAIHDTDVIKEKITDSKTMLICCCDLIPLSVLEPPKCDVMVGSLQPLGNTLSFGGPYGGYFACLDKYKRQIPGRVVGRTVDKEGNQAFCLTLQTREQHIRREKATSNICSNQALIALQTTIYLTLLGAQGLKQVAVKSASNARKLADKLLQKGFELQSKNFFNEFVLKVNNADEFLANLKENNILGGLKLDNNRILICVTEMNTDEEIDNYAYFAV